MSTATSTRRGDAKRAQERRQRLVMLAVAAVVVLGAVLIAVLSTGEAASRVDVDDIAGSPVVDGDPLPPPPDDPGSDPHIGAPAPLVEGADFDGAPVSIGTGQGPELLVFAASWCPACQQELPEIVEWLEAGRLPDGVTFTKVITGLDASRPNWPPTDWLDEEGYEDRVLVDDADGSVAGAYGLPATPYWVALDADGEVVLRVAGMLSQDQMDALASMVAG